MKQQRNTRQRQLVLDAVRSRQDHPTAEQIYQSVRERDAHVSRGTVYRNLNLLCEKQDIYRVVMADCDRFPFSCACRRVSLVNGVISFLLFVSVPSKSSTNNL